MADGSRYIRRLCVNECMIQCQNGLDTTGKVVSRGSLKTTENRLNLSHVNSV